MSGESRATASGEGTTRLVERVRVKNRMGLHTRPATAIVKMLQGCRCQVTLTHRKTTVNAKSILGILMLAATRNSYVTITVEGNGAELVMKRLLEAFENQFEESM